MPLGVLVSGISSLYTLVPVIWLPWELFGISFLIPPFLSGIIIDRYIIKAKQICLGEPFMVA